ncbi:hypothetical protein GCM10023317_84750 [Actinopolymorpha pittospori]
MQDEGDPFGRSQPVQDDEQGAAHRVRQDRFAFGVGAVPRTPGGLAQPLLERFLPPGPAGTKHVQADP